MPRTTAAATHTRHLATILSVLIVSTGLALVPGTARAVAPEWLPAEPAVTATNTENSAVVVDRKGRVVLAYDVVDYAAGTSTVFTTIRDRSGVWSDPVSMGSGLYPRLGTDAAGRTTLAWERIGPNPGDIYVAVLPSGSTSWGDPELVASLSGPSYPIWLSVSSSGAAAVAWSQRPGGDTRIVGGALRDASGTWAPPETLWTGSVFDGYAEVTVVATGPSSFGVVFAPATAFYESTLWRVEASDTSFGSAQSFGTVSGYVRFAADAAPNGAAAVAMIQLSAKLDPTTFGGITTVMTREAGQPWSAPTEIGRLAGSGVTVNPALAVDDSGVTTAAWLERRENPLNASEPSAVLVTSTSTPGSGWSPRGEQVIDHYSFTEVVAAATPDGDHVVVAAGSPTQDGTEPATAWTKTRAPDGSWSGFAAISSADGSFPTNLRLDVGADGTSVFTAGHAPASINGTSSGFDAWVSPGAGLLLDVSVYDESGNPVDGRLAPGQYIQAVVTVENNTDETLTGLTFGGAPLVVDSRSPGGVVITQAPPAPPTQLAPGAQLTLSYELSTRTRGLAATNTQVSATGQTTGDTFAEKQSLRFDIENGQVVDDALARLVIMQAVDRYLMHAYHEFMSQMEARADQLRAQLKKHLPTKVWKQYLGKGISLYDRLVAAQQGTPPSLVDARLPDRKFETYTVDQLNSAYDKSFLAEVKNGVADWAKNWAKTGKKAKAVAKDAYGEALMASFWMFGNATPEERMEFEAKMIGFADLNQTSATNIVNTLKREIPNWKANATYLADAVDLSIADVTLQSPDIKAILQNERNARANLLKLADTDPIKFQQAWAKRDAEIFNIGVPLILDTVLGGGVARLGGVKILGEGRAVVNSGEALGVVKNGAQAAGTRTAVTITGEGGVPAARTSEEFLANIDGATVVQSSDLGNVYELPNVGGVPEITLDAKAGILSEIESEYAAANPGKELKLAEVLKPSSPIRKPGGVAKLELTEQKTGKAVMVDAGAPREVLGEAAVWHSPEHPSKLPGFSSWDNARQQAAIKEWTKANQRWAEWKNPAPGSKTARLQQCIGQKSTVPLDLEPNASGVQRFVTAEFETVPVKSGKARGELIRVKSYEVEVRVNGTKVNTKQVVKPSKVALPQTADADAVAVAKQVGTDAAGKPVLEPLNRAEREFVMQKYIDKNIKARRTGLIPDAAEHGVTLVMDDASAKAAGKLLPAYGVPFLPEGPGKAYLSRIAKFVAPAGTTSEEMLDAMLRTVQSEGGFGQHAVVVTKDTRYLGELNVSQW